MANISKAERQRREAESQNSAPEIKAELAAAEVTVSEPEVSETPVTPITPIPEPVAPAKAEKTVFDVSDQDLKHFQSHKLAEEKKKSLDAIEQAVTDSIKIAEDKIRRDPVVAALAADPGDIGKRMEFLRKYGPSNVKPPKPAPTPFGLKDPELMEWVAKYEPDDFIGTYGHMKAPLVQRLLASIRANA